MFLTSVGAVLFKVHYRSPPPKRKIVNPTVVWRTQVSFSFERKQNNIRKKQTPVTAKWPGNAGLNGQSVSITATKHFYLLPIGIISSRQLAELLIWNLVRSRFKTTKSHWMKPVRSNNELTSGWTICSKAVCTENLKLSDAVHFSRLKFSSGRGTAKCPSIYREPICGTAYFTIVLQFWKRHNKIRIQRTDFWQMSRRKARSVTDKGFDEQSVPITQTKFSI